MCGEPRPESEPPLSAADPSEHPDQSQGGDDECGDPEDESKDEEEASCKTFPDSTAIKPYSKFVPRWRWLTPTDHVSVACCRHPRTRRLGTNSAHRHRGVPVLIRHHRSARDIDRHCNPWRAYITRRRRTCITRRRVPRSARCASVRQQCRSDQRRGLRRTDGA